MKASTFALLFLLLIIMSLIIPCLGAASKKGKEKEKAPVNKQKEKDKQAKKDIKEYVKKSQDLINGPIDETKTLIAIATFSAALVSLSMLFGYLTKWMNSAVAIALFVVAELWLYQHVEETLVSMFWQWYKFQNNTLKLEL